MDYKEKAAILRVCSSKKGERCSRCPAFGQGNRNCLKNAMRDGATAITDLLIENQALRNAANGFKARCEELEAKNNRLEQAQDNTNVAPVVHGKWKYLPFYKRTSMGVIECQACKAAFEGSIGFNFCPNCGRPCRQVTEK